jgi:hypothetical protein
MESLTAVIEEFNEIANAKRFVFRIMRLFREFDVELLCWVVSVCYRVSERWIGGNFDSAESLMVFCLTYNLNLGLFVEECYSLGLLLKIGDTFVVKSKIRR